MTDVKAAERPIDQFEAAMEDMGEHFAKAVVASGEAVQRMGALGAEIQAAQAIIAASAARTATGGDTTSDDLASYASRLSLTAQGAALSELSAILHLLLSMGQEMSACVSIFDAAQGPLRIAWSAANVTALAELAAKRDEFAGAPAPAAPGLN